MGQPPRKKKSKLLMLIVVAVIAVLVTSVILYRLYVGTSDSSQLNDPSNDVVLSVGTQYPGMIDVVSAGLKVNGTTLTVTVNVADSVSVLGDGEYAQWNITLILENDTDVLKTYEISVNTNSTQLTGSVVDVDAETVQTCQVDHYKNSLTAVAVMSELNGTKIIEWNILTTYESYSGDELTTSASDMAPDESLQQTVLGT
jgi:flagellar basal body-associated protein FliL